MFTQPRDPISEHILAFKNTDHFVSGQTIPFPHVSKNIELMKTNVKHMQDQHLLRYFLYKSFDPLLVIITTLKELIIDVLNTQIEIEVEVYHTIVIQIKRTIHHKTDSALILENQTTMNEIQLRHKTPDLGMILTDKIFAHLVDLRIEYHTDVSPVLVIDHVHLQEINHSDNALLHICLLNNQEILDTHKGGNRGSFDFCFKNLAKLVFAPTKIYFQVFTKVVHFRETERAAKVVEQSIH